MDGEDEVVLVVCGEECDAAPMFDINTGEEILRIYDCLAPPSGLACVAGCLLATSRPDKDPLVFGGAIYFWDLNKVLADSAIPSIKKKDGTCITAYCHSSHIVICSYLALVWIEKFSSMCFPICYTC
jgi:hypothetical protein